jgi:hypothetical protein
MSYPTKRTDTIRAYFTVKSLHHMAKDVLPCFLIAASIQTNVFSRPLALPHRCPRKLSSERLVMRRDFLEIHKA